MVTEDGYQSLKAPEKICVAAGVIVQAPPIRVLPVRDTSIIIEV
ncbi:hypothetical protein Q1M63_22215 [Sinorhizobium meliloti]|nr:hypothetical protein Q1M63_22215 [Sinorhizobium meliloti]